MKPSISSASVLPGLAAVLAAALPAQSLVRDIHPGVLGSIHGEIVKSGDRVFFIADDGVHGREVWTSDGTSRGTHLVGDINPGPGHGALGPLVPFRNGVLLAGEEPVFGREPYYATGISVQPVSDLFPGPVGSNPTGFFVASNGTAYFTANEPQHGPELWSTASGGGCTLVWDINPGPDGSFAAARGEAGSGIVLTAFHPAYGAELWITSGSGATLLADINPGPTGSVTGSFAASRGPGTVFFAAFHPASGVELYATDGSPAGTRLVQDLEPGSGSSQPAHFAMLGGECLFAATTTGTGRELYRATAAAGSVTLVRDIVSGAAGSSPAELTVAGTRVFFVATDATHGTEFYCTDGTGPGTVLLGDILPGALSGATYPLYPLGAGTRVLLRGRDPVAGEEGWVSDGTPAGTGRLFDLNPGPVGSQPRGFSVVGDQVLFAGDDGVVGYELFAIPLGVAGGSVVEEIGAGCPGTGGVVPLLRAVGVPFAGNPSFGYRLDLALPSSLTGLFLAFGSVTTPLGGGCTFYLPFGSITRIGTTDTNGHFGWPLAIPVTPSFVGANLFTQAAVVDPGGALAGAAALSNALRIVVGQS